MQLHGEWREEGGQGENESSKDGRQSSRLPTTEGHDQRRRHPAAA